MPSTPWLGSTTQCNALAPDDGSIIAALFGFKRFGNLLAWDLHLHCREKSVLGTDKYRLDGVAACFLPLQNEQQMSILAGRPSKAAASSTESIHDHPRMKLSHTKKKLLGPLFVAQHRSLREKGSNPCLWKIIFLFLLLMLWK